MASDNAANWAPRAAALFPQTFTHSHDLQPRESTNITVHESHNRWVTKINKIWSDLENSYNGIISQFYLHLFRSVPEVTENEWSAIRHFVVTGHLEEGKIHAFKTRIMHVIETFNHKPVHENSVWMPQGGGGYVTSIQTLRLSDKFSDQVLGTAGLVILSLYPIIMCTGALVGGIAWLLPARGVMDLCNKVPVWLRNAWSTEQSGSGRGRAKVMVPGVGPRVIWQEGRRKFVIIQGVQVSLKEALKKSKRKK